jgi:hypothetical protein
MTNKLADQQNLYGDSLKPETVFRIHRHERDYLQVSNATVQDKRLSWEARGLLVYLLSLPTDWEIRVSHLQKQGSAGRDALRKMLHELQRFGYASGVGRESQERGERGRFGPTEIAVYETPDLNPYHTETESPSPENPSTVPPSPESPSPENPSPYKGHSPQRTQGTKHTHTNLRAVGAPAEGVCVDEFPLKTFERYARNQPEIRNPSGWASTARRTGEWNERVARWCEEHAIDPRTGEAVGSPGENASLAAIPPAPRKCPPECPHCFGSGWETVPGNGSRRCPNLSGHETAA